MVIAGVTIRLSVFFPDELMSIKSFRAILNKQLGLFGFGSQGADGKNANLDTLKQDCMNQWMVSRHLRASLKLSIPEMNCYMFAS